LQAYIKRSFGRVLFVNSHIFPVPKPETKWTSMLTQHDVGHVFFGVNTSILDEAAGDYWTWLGTDLPFKEYLDYANTPEAKKLIKDIGIINIVKYLVFSLPLLFRIYFCSRNMSQKWVTKGYGKHMDTPLAEIRDEFNLRILDYNM